MSQTEPDSDTDPESPTLSPFLEELKQGLEMIESIFSPDLGEESLRSGMPITPDLDTN